MSCSRTSITRDITTKINSFTFRRGKLPLHSPDKSRPSTHASFQAAGYAVLIGDGPNQKYTSTCITYATIAYGSKTYTPSNNKMSIYAKGFLVIYLAFKEFGHLFWGATKPLMIITNSKSVTRPIQAKTIPPLLWNA